MSVSSLVQSLAQEKPGKGWNVIGELKDQGIALVKESASNAGNTGDFGSIPESGRSPGVGQATHSSILAWRILSTEPPGRLSFIGLQRVGHN